MINNLAGIRFDEAELDRTIDEINIATNLPVECKRSLAAFTLITLSMAMAIKDEVQYLVAITDLGNIPEEDDELMFLSEFGGAMVFALEQDLKDSTPQMLVFSRRAQNFVNSVNLLCH